MGKTSAFLAILVALTSCTKNKTDQTPTTHPEVETFPIENAQLKNCRFKDPKPAYTYNAAITPNPIICDEGVPTRVERLTPAELPAGLEFSKEQLSLVGTPTEKAVDALYDFYLENEAGYVVIKLQMTVK